MNGGHAMSPVLLATLLLGALMARQLTSLYFGGHYRCPSCGARSEDKHSPDCPWSHSPSA
jgi:hypothetical protein